MRSNWPALAALLIASQSPAQVAKPSVDFANLSDAQLGDRLNKIATEGFANACGDKVPLFAEVSRRRPDNAELKGLELFAQAMCAYEEKRLPDSLRLLKQAETKYGIRAVDFTALAIASQLGDGQEALSRFQTLAANGQLVALSNASFYGALNVIRLKGLQPKFDEIAYQAALSGEMDRIDPNVQTGLATRALSYAARSGDLSHVDDLLRHVRAPAELISLLSLRQYEPIWPQVERVAGDNMATVINAFVSSSSKRLSDKPEDLDRLSDYATALLFAGRYEELNGLADKWLARPGRNGKYAEGDGWALNMKAYAASAVGRTAEADKVFDDLAKLSPEEYPWVVSFVINREARLVRQGRWAEAIAASEVARPVAQAHGSPYAKMLVASQRACAFDRLGRKDESETEFRYVMANYSDAPTSAVEALLCAGRKDQAAVLFKRILGDDTIRDQMLNDLQDDRFDLYWSGPAKAPRIYEFVMGRPDLKREAMKYVRAIPDRFVPLEYVRRQEIAARSGK